MYMCRLINDEVSILLWFKYIIWSRWKYILQFALETFFSFLMVVSWKCNAVSFRPIVNIWEWNVCCFSIGQLLRCIVSNSIHPSHWLILWGANPSWPWVKGGVDPGQVPSPSCKQLWSISSSPNSNLHKPPTDTRILTMNRLGCAALSHFQSNLVFKPADWRGLVRLWS